MADSDLSRTDASEDENEAVFEAVERPASKDPSPTQADGRAGEGDVDGALPVGAAVEAKWMELSRDGKFHYYPATVEIVHDEGAEYTVRWVEPGNYEPTLRLPSKFVREPVQSKRGAKGPSKPRKRKDRTRGPPFSGTGLDCESDKPKAPVVSSRGRQVSCVKRFSASGADEEALQRTILASARQAKEGSPAAWVGDAVRETGGRKYYEAVRLRGSSSVVRVGDCVLLRPTSAWRSGWESGLPWVAMVRDLFEEEGEMLYSCVWFYRPQDCSPKALLRDTLQKQEVFLTDEMDDNSVRSIMKKCRVLGEKEFREQQSKADEDSVSMVADSEDEESGEGKEEDALLCRCMYDVTGMVLMPIVDTAAALRSAVTSMLVENKIMQHIRDFQIKWIGCLHRYGHYKQSDEGQEEPTLRSGQHGNHTSEVRPKARRINASASPNGGAGHSKPSSVTSHVALGIGGKSHGGVLSAPSPANSQATARIHSFHGESTSPASTHSTPPGGLSRKRPMGAFADSLHGGSRRPAQPVPSRSSSSPIGKPEQAPARAESPACPASRPLGLPESEVLSVVPITSAALAASAHCTWSSCSVESCDEAMGDSRDTPVFGKKRGREGGGTSSKKAKITLFGNKKKDPMKSLQYVHAEFVDAKWDDGFFYPAFIVKRLSRGKADNFKECLVEWSDPEGHPGYWEKSGYSRTAKVKIENIRPAKGQPPENVSGPSSATMKKHCTEEDWQKAAEKAAVEQSVADAGLEWHPNLSILDVRSQPGCKKLWICTARHCGQAFTGLHFLRAHQLSKEHGKWKDMVPQGKETVAELDCTRSGSVTFVSQSVERNCRKLVRQISSSEEPRINDSEVPGKVLHTGENGRGFALFASRDITTDQYLGHYSGAIRDIGYKKKFSGHYTFGLLHCWAMDGTAGGAWRFMNHCLERQVPTVRALVVNHFGVPHIALYANRDIKEGEELLLRYQDISDSEFFAVECGQD